MNNEHFTTVPERDIVSHYIARLVVVECIVLGVLFALSVFPFVSTVVAVVGAPNATVQTILSVGQVSPEIINVTLNNGATSLDLVANSTVTLLAYVVARDFNGEGDIANITAEFFDNVASSYGAVDDNNIHYTNNTCAIDYGYGDLYHVSANCTFSVYYYANNATWNVTARVTDNSSRTGIGGSSILVNQLLALALPDVINYGTVNASDVSDEIIANVTNAGNTQVNLSLSGYAQTVGDGYAMNCSLGAVQNISIEYEKYNLTASNPGPLTFSQFEVNYTNLTALVAVRTFNLFQRQNDTLSGVDDTNQSFWRIYVPPGVAGNCTGNIVFGATIAAGT